MLGYYGPMRIARLADEMAMERTTLLRALKPMQSAGWVKSKTSEQGRAIELSITESGRQIFGEAIPLWKAAQEAFDAEIGHQKAIRFRNQLLEIGRKV
jgi:DNA-binding MarR family transcriptional regulator